MQVADGSSNDFNLVKSGIPRGSALGPLLFMLFIGETWNGISFKIIYHADGNADGASLYATISSPQNRALVDSVFAR